MGSSGGITRPGNDPSREGSTVMAQPASQFGKKLFEIALGLGFITKRADFLAFPGAEIPQVLVIENALAALRRLGSVTFAVALVRHGRWPVLVVWLLVNGARPLVNRFFAVFCCSQACELRHDMSTECMGNTVCKPMLFLWNDYLVLGGDWSPLV